MVWFYRFLQSCPHFHFLTHLHDRESIPSFNPARQLVVVVFMVLSFCVIILLATFHWNAITRNPGLSLSSNFHLFCIAFVLYTVVNIIMLLLCIISGISFGYAGVVRNAGSWRHRHRNGADENTLARVLFTLIKIINIINIIKYYQIQRNRVKYRYDNVSVKIIKHYQIQNTKKYSEI